MRQKEHMQCWSVYLCVLVHLCILNLTTTFFWRGASGAGDNIIGVKIRWGTGLLGCINDYIKARVWFRVGKIPWSIKILPQLSCWNSELAVAPSFLYPPRHSQSMTRKTTNVVVQNSIEYLKELILDICSKCCSNKGKKQWNYKPANIALDPLKKNARMSFLRSTGSM